ncbi:eclosion hormone isoform X2 [Atheta coriaria]|uniref:eclosion hormone isoform X2 n=1 Tax=Dalotia coriaria TaxID=877792 RepID=UPI0031F424EB
MGRAGFYDFHAKRINAATNAHIDKLTRKLHQKVDFFADIMGSLKEVLLLVGVLFLFNYIVLHVDANPIGVCIRNCAQCKKMFGPYFEGQLCADACVKFKGKIIPDCEDIGSIAPFLNKFD